MNTNKKTHKLANKKKFQVTFGFVGGKWNFRIGDFTLLTKVPGGKKSADRIAEILRKSWFRAGNVDGAARNAINRIVNVGQGQLKDYRGPWDHNWSWADGKSSVEGHTVEMVPPSQEIRPVEVKPTLPVVEAEPENGFIPAINVIQSDALEVA